jgi:GNAT superfamily N-acetyltransferase
MRQEVVSKAEALELSAPVKLGPEHITDQFSSGESSIDDYLWNTALKAQAARHAVVWVVCFKGTNEVAGFYTLSSGGVDRQYGLTAKMRRNAPNPLPVTVLGRMGVTKKAQGQGVALDLLADVIERCVLGAESIGSTALIVHPLTEKLAEFYAKHGGFEPCADLSPLTMMLPLR